ncbi:MAG: hypothetical protein ACPHCJ_03010 [Oceanococcaceae bacterium]
MAEGDQLPQISKDAMEQLLENQSKELEIRAKEVEVDAAREDNNHVYALRALDVEAADRKDHRDGYIKIMKLRVIAASVMSVIVVALLLGLVALSEPDIAMELVKAGLFVGSGSIGGYFFGKSRADNSKKD